MLRASPKTKTEAMEGNWSARSRNQAHGPGLDGGRDEEDGGVKDIAKISGLGDWVLTTGSGNISGLVDLGVWGKVTFGRDTQWAVWFVNLEIHTETLKQTQKPGPHRTVPQTKIEVRTTAAKGGIRASRKQQHLSRLPWEGGAWKYPIPWSLRCPAFLHKR